MTHVSIRPITQEDDHLLRLCHDYSRQGELESLGWSQEQRELFLLTLYERQRQLYHVHYDWSQFGIITLAEQDIGCLLINEHQEHIELIDFTLLPDFRGQGHARQIIHDLQQQALSKGKAIKMMLSESNCGFDFYLKLGFTKQGKQGDAWVLIWQPTSAAVS